MNALFQQLDLFLQMHTTLTLATWTPDGPQAAPVFFAHAWISPAVGAENLQLYFISSPTSEHCRALIASAQVAATIYQDEQAWREIRGVQLRGTARLVDAGETDFVVDCYTRKFLFVADTLKRSENGAVELAGPLAKAKFYLIQPNWARLIDNTQGFGHRDEITWGTEE